jgi:hypothetical protein
MKKLKLRCHRLETDFRVDIAVVRAQGVVFPTLGIVHMLGIECCSQDIDGMISLVGSHIEKGFS